DIRLVGDRLAAAGGAVMLCPGRSGQPQAGRAQQEAAQQSSEKTHDFHCLFDDESIPASIMYVATFNVNLRSGYNFARRGESAQKTDKSQFSRPNASKRIVQAPNVLTKNL